MNRQPETGARQSKLFRPREVRYETRSFGAHIGILLALSLVITLIVEGLNQGTIARMLNYLTARTGYFLLNWMIVFSTLSISELFKRRQAVVFLIGVAWLGLGIANSVIIHDRTQPLISADLLISREAFSMISLYLTPLQIILLCACCALVILGLILLFTRTRQVQKVNYPRSIAWAASWIIAVFGMHLLALNCGWMPDDVSDRVSVFRDCGFITSFTFTLGETGIRPPESYSTQAVTDIIREPAPTQPAAVAARFGDDANLDRPNVIFLQLEAFFDVDTVRGVQLSADPQPNFHALLDAWPNAKLFVPAVGGSTANVEFEVLSGMNMDFFGAGEVPYSTVIQETTCESIATILRRYGYSTTVLHNNTGAFYDRNHAYANLGLNRFDSLEYMPYPKYTKLGWAKDEILTGEILRMMETTPGRDMALAISVESHGKYSDTYTYTTGDIRVERAPEEVFFEAFQNYVNVVDDVDAFLGKLTAALNDFDEPVLLIIYGDHLPGLGLTPEILETGDLYASRYIVWNNYGAKFEAQDMQAYRLGSEVLRWLGISDGVITRFHQSYPVDETGEAYLKKLKTLEYDLLYGDQQAYGETGAPERSRLQMGLEPVRATEAVLEYDRLMITGAGFTEYSRVICDGRELPTVFIDDMHIAVAEEDLPIDTSGGVCVAQITPTDKELSRTDFCAIQTVTGRTKPIV